MSFGRSALAPQIILDGVAATGVGTTINVNNFKHAVIEISSTNGGNFTVKAQGAIGTGKLGEIAPNFGAAKTNINPWSNIQMVDLLNGSSIDGAIGVSFVGTDDVKIIELNTNALDYINFNVTTYTAGNITVRVRLYSND